MLGEKLAAAEEQTATRPAPAQTTGGALSVAGVTVAGVLDDVNLTVRVGEIVGLAGVAGAGHQALLEVISGVRPASAGTLRLPGTTDPSGPPPTRQGPAP